MGGQKTTGRGSLAARRASSSATSTRNFRPPVSGVGLMRNTALAPPIFVKGAHGDETLFAGVAEQGLGEDLDLIAVGFEQSALTGVTHGAKCKGRVGGPPLASSSSKRNLVVHHGAANSLLGLLCRDLSLGRRRCCGVGHFPAHDFE